MSEYDDGFDAGILHQCMQERDEDARRELEQRAAAFGALRRAAKVARLYDARAQSEKEAHPNSWHYCEWDYWEYDEARNAIRAAIRAAIGGAS